MKVFDLKEVLASSPEMVTEDGQAMFWGLGEFNGGHAWVGRYRGESDWTCHPDGDAILNTLEGEVTVRLLTEQGEEQVEAGPGCVYVLPRGTWHKYVSSDWVLQFGAMAGTTLHSAAADPRRE